MDILNSVLAAVSVRLRTLFPKTPIFTEEVPQNLPEPCFLLSFTGDAEISAGLTGQFKASGTISIKYFPPKRQAEVRKVLQEMFCTLSLQLKNLLYENLSFSVSRHSCRIEEDILHHTCKFTLFIREVDNSPLMEEIRLQIKKEREK